jgi:hypothetical protein
VHMPTSIEDFFRTKVPSSWFAGPVDVRFDDDEILCVGTLPPAASVDEFRDATRKERIEIAREAESAFRRRVSWGVEHEGMQTLFTSQSVPVTTRLRFAERAVLDTLVEAGVARSRSDALGWCVKLVGRHEADWLADLRGALVDVERVRAEGPALI